MHEQEEWRPVVGQPKYQVSNLGRIYSSHVYRGQPGRRLRQPVDSDGYRVVQLYAGDGTSVHRRVHVLVAEAFHGPRPEGSEVRHLDGDKLNNNATNLAHGTRSENMQDQLRHGVHFQAARTRCPSDHLYTEATTRRTPNGRRECLICRRERERRYRIRKSLRAASVPSERAA